MKLSRTILPTLRRADPRLAWLIERVGPFAMDAPRQRSHLEALCRSIVYQQLSGKAAATIFSRFRSLWDTVEFPTAAQILQRSDEELRGCGLSFAKLSYLRDLCQQLVTEPHFLADVDDLDDARHRQSLRTLSQRRQLVSVATARAARRGARAVVTPRQAYSDCGSRRSGSTVHAACAPCTQTTWALRIGGK